MYEHKTVDLTRRATEPGHKASWMRVHFGVTVFGIDMEAGAVGWAQKHSLGEFCATDGSKLSFLPDQVCVISTRLMKTLALIPLHNCTVTQLDTHTHDTHPRYHNISDADL